MSALSARPYPHFPKIDPDTVGAGVMQALKSAREQLDALVADASTRNSITTADVVMSLEELNHTLEAHWSPLRHLHSVADTPAIRAAYEECLAALTTFYTELGQHEQLFTILESCERQIDDATGDDVGDVKSIVPQHLEAALNHRLRDMRLTGAGLPAEQQEKNRDLYKRIVRPAEPVQHKRS